MPESVRPPTLTVTFPPEQFEALARRVANALEDGRDDGFLDTNGAAEYLGLTRKAVYALVERRKLPPRTRRVSSMSKIKASDSTKRIPGRYTGVSYRVRKDGTRRYSVYHGGRYWPVEGNEQAALVKQGELCGKVARGEKPVAPTKATFRDVAEEYMESKIRLRAGTRKTYRATLDRILIPRFGGMKVGALTVKHVRLLIRDLEP